MGDEESGVRCSVTSCPRHAPSFPPSMLASSERALTNWEISVYICWFVFFFFSSQSQQYWERVTLGVCVFPGLSVFLSPPRRI